MRIDNHMVAMNAQYYNVKFESIEAKISHTEEEFTKGDSTALNAVQEDSILQNRDTRELSRELSKALMKNISSDSQRVIGDRVEVTSIQAEAQELNFSVAAIVQADGKEIELNLDVSLSRSFVKKEVFTRVLNPNLTDPLVINLNGQMPSLNSKTFSFDIDSDGMSDQISKLNAGNVFLALDKNENGIVDNGTELFGTKSGDGFADLSKYDEDNNGWIDENDPIFDKLRIWEGDGENSELIALGEVGIGAIFLGNTKTPFSLKDETNALLGEIRSSSFVLFENGKAGVISQVDLAINSDTKKSLTMLENIQKDISSLNLHELYTSTDKIESESDSTDNKMQKIKSKIISLEADLKGAKDSAKPGIEARIGALYAQMMALLEAQ